MPNSGLTEILSAGSGGAFFPESKEYLQRVFWPAATDRHPLREEDERATVEDVEIEGGNDFGENYGSAMVFATVKIRTRKGPKSVRVVIKTLKKTRWLLEMMNVCKLFEKEVEFFNNTLPAMVRFQTERGVRRHLTELVPKCLFAKAVGDEQIVITEDLRPKGFRMADRHLGLGLRHSILALEALGRFHAASLAMKTLEPEAFWKASRSAVKEAYFTEDRKIMYDLLYRQIARGKIEYLVGGEAERGAEDADLLLKVAKVADRVIEQRGQLSLEVLQRYREPLAVINHGDFWVNNIMYRYEKNERGEEIPVSARLVDFQMTRYGSPSLDLHTFLYTSTTLKLREDHEEDLLRAYHGALIAGIREAGVDLESAFQCEPETVVKVTQREKLRRRGNADLPDNHPLSFKALQEDLIRHWPWGLMLAELMLRIVLGDASGAEDAIEATMMNMTPTQKNGDKEEKIVGYEMLKQLTCESSDKRYLEVIREFAHKGYLDNETS